MDTEEPEDNFDLEALIKDNEKRLAKLEGQEEQGIQDILKYFDRIHDKLFSVNNILIGGYLALIAFKKDVPYTIAFVPMLNMGLLLFLDYRMMEKSRLESRLLSLSPNQIKKIGRIVSSTNGWSLLVILSTVVVSAIFIYFLR